MDRGWKMQKVIYKSSITVGSLLIRESQVIAKLLLENVNENSWNNAIVTNNLLQKRSPESAKIQAKLIKERLVLMKPDLWNLIYSGTSEVIVQALLAASIKHSPLLGDFMH